MQATASREGLQSLQTILCEGPVRISPGTAREMGKPGLDEVWLVSSTRSPGATVPTHVRELNSCKAAGCHSPGVQSNSTVTLLACCNQAAFFPLIRVQEFI